MWPDTVELVGRIGAQSLVFCRVVNEAENPVFVLGKDQASHQLHRQGPVLARQADWGEPRNIARNGSEKNGGVSAETLSL